MPAKSKKQTTSEPFTKQHTINLVIETPRGKRNKFHYDEKRRQFSLKKVLPAGSSFPYDFGFVPGTKAQDGDPLDVLVLMDESAFPGCRVESRLVGVIEAEQVEDGKSIRNDRLVAVASAAHDYHQINSLKDVNDNLLQELEHFFKSYNEADGREFKLLGIKGPNSAHRLVEKNLLRVVARRKRRKAK